MSENFSRAGKGNLPSVPATSTPIAYKGVPVMTTDRLADAYGVEAKHIQDNHANNRSRFTEGVHFFKVTGAELKALKTDPTISGQFDKRAPALILWTERGARRHAKILDNDVAWSVFEELEDCYFAGKVAQIEAQPQRPALGTIRDVAATFKGFFGIARMVGLDPNQAALAASRGVKNTVGVDPLGEMGVTHLLAPQQEAHVTATQIGAKICERTGAGKVSGQAANKLLEKHGFQVRDQNADAGWAETEKGRPYAVWQDTAKRHSDGAPVRQLRWSAGIVDALIAAMAGTPVDPVSGSDAQH